MPHGLKIKSSPSLWDHYPRWVLAAKAAVEAMDGDEMKLRLKQRAATQVESDTCMGKQCD